MLVALSTGMLTALTGTGMSQAQTAFANTEHCEDNNNDNCNDNRSQYVDNENNCKIENENSDDSDNNSNTPGDQTVDCANQGAGRDFNPHGSPSP
jgi:hypothetical protein